MMKKVDTFDELNTIIKEVGKGKGVTSNFFMLKEEIQWYINEKRMYYCIIKAGIYIICDEGEFYHLYYKLKTNMLLDDIKLDKPIMVKFVGHEARTDNNMLHTVELFSQIGFIQHSKTRRMIRENGKKFFNSCFSNDVIVRYAEIKDLKSIASIWKNSLDSLLHPLFEEKYICDLIKSRNVLCAENISGKIVGGLQMEKLRNSVMLWYIAIDKDIRYNGIGSLLVQKMIDISLKMDAKTTTVWVVEDNVNAIRFYKKLGYLFDGMYSYQYLLKASI